VDDLVERLRAVLAEQERRIDRRERDAELRAEPRERWEQHHYAAAQRLERLRTIQAHREMVARLETARVARDAAVDTPLAGATRLVVRLNEENVRLLLRIYFPESADG